MTQDDSPHRVTIPFSLHVARQSQSPQIPQMPLGLHGHDKRHFTIQLESRGGEKLVAAWTRAHESLKAGLVGFYGDECGFLFVLSVLGLPWFCWSQTKRNTFVRQWLADLNSVLEPHGLYAKFQRLVARDDNGKDELWLAIATTREDADALRREPIFWRRAYCGPGRYPQCCLCCYCCCCQAKVV